MKKLSLTMGFMTACSPVLASTEIGAHQIPVPVSTMVCETQAAVLDEASRPQAPISNELCRMYTMYPGQEYTNLAWIDVGNGTEILLAVLEVDGELMFTVRQLRERIGEDA